MKKFIIPLLGSKGLTSKPPIFEDCASTEQILKAFRDYGYPYLKVIDYSEYQKVKAELDQLKFDRELEEL